MDAKPSVEPPPEVSLDDYFKAWREEEAKLDLSDLRPQDALVFAIFWVLFAVVLWQFVTRYVLNDSAGWTEEIARYLLIGVTFVGAVTAMRKRSHIAVEAALVFAPPRVKHWLLVGVDGAVMLFSALMTWHSVVLADRTPGYMVSIDVSKSVLYWCTALAFAGMTLHAAIGFVRRLAGREDDKLHGLTID